MDTRYLFAVIEELDVIWLGIALLTILFYFFFLKVRFSKHASERAYGVLFYSFVAYSVAALSYILLQALDRFLRIQDDLYSDFLWFFPVCLLAALTGAAVGFMLHWAASKIAPGYAYRLLNLSLIILLPLLVYVLLLKPYYATFGIPVQMQKPEQSGQEFNLTNAEPITTLPDTMFPAVPSQLFDSIQINIQQGQQIQFLNQANGFTWFHRLPVKQVQQLYVAPLAAGKKLAILAVCAALQQQSTLVVFDTLGMPVFQKIFQDGTNRLAVSEALPLISLYREENDSLVLTDAYRFY